MECVELAPAVGCMARFESGSKLHALHTLRAVWFRLCRPGDRRALPTVSERLLWPRVACLLPAWMSSIEKPCLRRFAACSASSLLVMIQPAFRESLSLRL